MKYTLKAFGYGLLIWIIPFITSFLFVDSSGNFTIPETFFKTIMIVEGALIGVVFAALYFKAIQKEYLTQGLALGLIWLAINWMFDLIMVSAGFFKMSYWQYFTDIGFRYLSMPIYTIGVGYILQDRNK